MNQIVINIVFNTHQALAKQHNKILKHLKLKKKSTLTRFRKLQLDKLGYSIMRMIIKIAL